MIRRLVTLTAAIAGSAARIAALRHRAIETGRRVPGGILIVDPGAYDALTHRLLLGSLFKPIAADIAAAAAAGARILEVGCGPGHLTMLLTREDGLDVTGLDLDPAMIERAQMNADRASDRGGRRPSFVVGDAAALPFSDGSFDLVVSTMSMHHWADPKAGLDDIRRVLRPAGRALIWDFRPGMLPFHRHMPDPLDQVRGSSLQLIGVTPWRWPWRLTLLERIELGGPAATD
jgi:SAM-dependent methyltransferase